MLFNLGYPMMFLRWSSGPVTVTFFLAVVFHLLLDQVFTFSILGILASPLTSKYLNCLHEILDAKML